LTLSAALPLPAAFFTMRLHAYIQLKQPMQRSLLTTRKYFTVMRFTSLFFLSPQ
jgi:hypothetical protein